MGSDYERTSGKSRYDEINYVMWTPALGRIMEYITSTEKMVSIMGYDVNEFIKSFINVKEKNNSLLQYNLNIIDELHADENAYTRILLKLLNFELNQKKVILEEFLNILNEKLTAQKIQIYDDYGITGQFEFIDGYIWSDSKKTSIIIENKINWACDQDKQIQRYIEVAKKYGINEKNIFVVYLTDNGIKKAADYSFTDYAKQMLDWKNSENPGRYIELNYQYDILPFLYKIFNNFAFSKENVIKSAIFQYIDYLEGRFGMRKKEKEFERAMNEDILRILNLSDNLSEKEKFERIEELQWDLWNTLDKVKNEVYPDRPEIRLNDYYNFFKDQKGSFDDIGIWRQGGGLIFRNCKKFTDYEIKFEVYPEEDGTYIIFKVQEEIEDKSFIKDILEKMDILNEYEEAWENGYQKTFDASKNNIIKEYITNFIQKFDTFVKNT